MRHIIQLLLIGAVVLISPITVGEQKASVILNEQGEVRENNEQVRGGNLALAARNRTSVVIPSGEIDEEDEPVQERMPAGRVYTVKDGDTLWDISARLFDDPYVWPRIWSYNMQITNPNWIYPGDQIKLYRSEMTGDGAGGAGVAGAGQGGGIQSFDGQITSAMPKDGILFRNKGFIDKEALKKAGQIKGSHRERKMLAQHDEAYVEFPDADPKIGERYAAFNILHEVESYEDPGTELGRFVEIKGLVRVISFDKKTKIARVIVEEALRTIPRGTLIGDVHRRLDIIPAVPNSKNVKGRIVANLHNLTLSATHHVVFVDKGLEEGVRDGNRFFAIEKRDGLRRIDNEPDDHPGYPVEVIAEMRVVEARPHTSTCLITSAIRELEVGQQVELRKGY